MSIDAPTRWKDIGIKVIIPHIFFHEINTRTPFHHIKREREKSDAFVGRVVEKRKLVFGKSCGALAAAWYTLGTWTHSRSIVVEAENSSWRWCTYCPAVTQKFSSPPFPILPLSEPQSVQRMVFAHFFAGSPYSGQ